MLSSFIQFLSPKVLSFLSVLRFRLLGSHLLAAFWVSFALFVVLFIIQELDLLEEEANVYKLIGPVLVKQDLAEANANVRKRIEYISAEL